MKKNQEPINLNQKATKIHTITDLNSHNFKSQTNKMINKMSRLIEKLQ
jgi:hypothetical protein